MKKNLMNTLIASIALLAVAGYAEEMTQEDQSFQEQAIVEVAAVEQMETSEELAFEEDALSDATDGEEENVVVDSRPLLPQARLQMEQARQSELEQTDEITQEEEIQLGVLIIPIKSQNLIALASNKIQSTAATLSPCHYQSITALPQQSIIKIDDGSEWIFDRSETYVLRNWKVGDKIIITPKQQLILGSHFTYVMTNKDVGDSISVNLFLGPVAFGYRSTWVVGIDQNLGKIYLMNGQGERTVWEVSSSDKDLFKDWKVNDTVIIGENDSWLWCFSSYNSMIINVNMNHYIRAQQVFQSNQR